jgi:hypothetical protein
VFNFIFWRLKCRLDKVYARELGCGKHNAGWINGKWIIRPKLWRILPSKTNVTDIEVRPFP